MYIKFEKYNVKYLKIRYNNFKGFVLYFWMMKKHSIKVFLGVSVLFLIVATQLFGGMEVKSVSIEIKEYHKEDRGKFWNICLYGSKMSTKGYVKFKIYTKMKKERSFEIGLIHLKEICNKKNIYIHATGRHTSKGIKDWYVNLNAEDIEKINVQVFEQETRGVPLFEKDVIPTVMN